MKTAATLVCLLTAGLVVGHSTLAHGGIFVTIGPAVYPARVYAPPPPVIRPTPGVLYIAPRPALPVVIAPPAAPVGFWGYPAPYRHPNWRR